MITFLCIWGNFRIHDLLNLILKLKSLFTALMIYIIYSIPSVQQSNFIMTLIGYILSVCLNFHFKLLTNFFSSNVSTCNHDTPFVLSIRTPLCSQKKRTTAS